MAKIELLLGGPTTADREEQIEELVYDHNICRETAVIKRVKALVEWVSRVNTNNRNYIDLVGTIDMDHEVKFPKVSFGVYEHNGYVLPKLVINGFHLCDVETGNKYFIGNRLIDVIGSDIEDTFEIEYWGFKRVGKVKPTKSDVIYLLNSKPHIYHCGQFLEASQ